MSRSGRVLLAALTAIALLMSPLLVLPAFADPTAILVGPNPNPGVIGERVTFDGSGSIPGDVKIKSYVFDFGDNSKPKNDKDGRIGHTYDQPGIYGVTLTVIDDDGNESAASTTATIIDPNQTTTTTTTTTTRPAGTTTTTTTIPFDPTTIPYDPTTTTTLRPTTTTSSTTTSTTTTTTAPRRATNAPAPTTSTSAPTTTTTTTAPTLEVLGTTVEAAGPAAGLSATAFSLVPATVAPGNEIALTLTLVARVPGMAAVRFLLDGEPLGDAATLIALDSSAETETQAVFTRTMPTGMQIGLHRVEVVTTGDTPQVLASRTVGVVAGDSTGPVALDQTQPPSESGVGLTVAIAVGAVLALAGAGFAGTSWYRRRAIVRRLNP